MTKRPTAGTSNGRTVGRRTVLAGAMGSAAAVGSARHAQAGPQLNPRRPGPRRSWVGTWGASPTGVAEQSVLTLQNQTVRMVTHTSKGGPALRIRLTNEFGATDLLVGEVRIARRASKTGTDIKPSTDREVTFGGAGEVTVAAGAPAVSDPIELELPDGEDLVVSLYLPEKTPVTTLHGYGVQVNAVASGNVTAEQSVTPTQEPQSYYFLSGIAVQSSRRAAAIVTLGDSITDGGITEVGANHRWPDLLAARLREQHSLDHLGVVNAGISGNRLLHDPNPPAGSDAEAFAEGFGVSALHRFDRDVLAQPGAEYLITLLGVNDLGHPGTVAPESETVSTEDLINGHRQLIARAHAAGLTAFGCTMLPFKDDTLGFWSAENGRKRRELNDWMSNSHAYDAVFDFAAATAAPGDPDRLHPDLDSGDGLHPNDAGAAAMAETIPLKLFR